MTHFKTLNKPTLYDEGIIVSASNSVEPTVDTESEIKRLKEELTAELNNRCCGNCAFFDIEWGTDAGETVCALFEHKPRERKCVYQDSDPCEFWRSCRG